MKQTILKIAIFASLLFFAILVAKAQPPEITFPIAELGNCQNEAECRTYCDDTAHIRACLNFAERHGLMPEDEIEEARKVAAALERGIGLPGDCTSKDACDAYCSKPKNMEECFNFALQAGFIPPEEAEQARKVMPLMVRGETPGGCRSKEACEAYCETPDHFEECITFAEKAGFVSHAEAQMARKTGGQGPGGCRSREACESFCNEPAHQEECFNFARDHGLIPPEKLEEIKEGMGRLRAGLSQAPPEVVNCLKENLGQNIIEDIESGKLVPGPQIGERVKACFEQFMPQLRQRLQQGLEQAPPEVLSCLRTTIGDQLLEKIKAGEAPDPEIGDKMRSCFEQFRPAMPQMPPAAIECVKQMYGSDFLLRLQRGEAEPPEDFREKIESCIMQSMPSVPPQVIPGRPPPGAMPGFVGPGGCRTEEECRAYCSDPAHQAECTQFQPPAFTPSPSPQQFFLRQLLQGAIRLLTR